MYLYGFLSEQKVPHKTLEGLGPTLGYKLKNLVSFRGLCKGPTLIMGAQPPRGFKFIDPSDGTRQAIWHSGLQENIDGVLCVSISDPIQVLGRSCINSQSNLHF